MLLTRAALRAGSILAALRLSLAHWLVEFRHLCSRSDEGQGDRELEGFSLSTIRADRSEAKLCLSVRASFPNSKVAGAGR